MTEVTQADRDAAACLLHGIKVGGGNGNTYYLSVPTPKDAAEAFARHRTTAEAAKDARIAELEQKLARVKRAADGVLAPICEKVGRCLIEAPEMEAVKVMHDYGVELPFVRLAELYDATDYEIAALQEIDNAG